MSDTIPITLYLVSPNNHFKQFGVQLFAFLSERESSTKARFSSDQRSIGHNKGGEISVCALSRNGGIIQRLEALIEKSGFTDLQFIGDATCTHEAVFENDYGNEILRFSVINNNIDFYINKTKALIQWCRDHPDVTFSVMDGELGRDLDLRNFVSIIDVIDNVNYSVRPNDDYFHDCDFSGDAAFAFCILKTIIYLLTKAKTKGYWVICEHWGGFE